MSSETENDLFGDETSRPGSPASSQPEAAPSPAAGSDDNNNDADPHDLFGEDDNEPPPKNARSSRSSTPASSAGEHPLEYGERSDYEDPGDERLAALPVPKWPRLQPTDGKVWMLKLPQHVGLDPRPYDADLYRSGLDGSDGDLKGPAAKGRMIEVRNTMRWRWVTGADGKPEKQANARMLRWSDGSVSLQLGGDMYDVQGTYGTTLARETDNYPETEATTRGSAETSYVCYAAGNEQVLLSETAVEGQLSLVPTSMDSKTHRELVKHVGQQHTKHSRMKILEDEAAPDRLKELLARAGPQRPAAAAGPKKPRQARGVAAGGGFGRRGAFGRATKRAESEESEDDREPRRTGGGGYDEDDGFVVADSDESDGEYRRKKKRRADEDSDMDATELAEARIEAREKRERKRAKTKKSRAYSDDEDDEDDAEGVEEEEEEEEDAMEMDVESEEE